MPKFENCNYSMIAYREAQGLITICVRRLRYEAFASAIGTFCNFLNNLGADNSIPCYHFAGTITGRTWLAFDSTQIAPAIMLCSGLIRFSVINHRVLFHLRYQALAWFLFHILRSQNRYALELLILGSF
jgi:hypothetical protein